MGTEKSELAYVTIGLVIDLVSQRFRDLAKTHFIQEDDKLAIELRKTAKFIESFRESVANETMERLRKAQRIE